MAATLSVEDLLARILYAVQQDKAMPPWFEAGYFLQPNITVVNYSPGPVKQLVQASGYRTGLLISSTSACWLYPNAIPTVANTGLQVSGTNLPFQLLFSDVGPLVQQQWWVNSLGSQSGTVTAIEILLREWPVQR